MNSYLEELINGLSHRHHMPLKQQINEINGMTDHRDLLSLQAHLRSDQETANPSDTVSIIAPAVNLAIQSRIMELEGKDPSATLDGEDADETLAFNKLVDGAIENAASPGQKELLEQVKKTGQPIIAEPPEDKGVE